jgi:MFS family permease
MKTKPNTGSLLADLRALPQPCWVLLAGTFINRFGTFVMPFLTIYMTRRGHSLVDASYAVSAFGVGALGGSTLGGWLADRIGRRNTIVLGTFAAAALYMLLHYAVTMPQILICTMLAGLSAGTYPPASGALLADIVPEALRVRAYSALRVAMNAGFACGASTAGFLAKYSFFWLFAGDALTSAVYGVIALIALPHGIRAAKANAPWKDALAHIAGNRPFHAAFAGALLTALVFAQFGTTYSAFVISLGLSLDIGSLHLSGETLYGVLLAWNGVMVMLFELPLTSATQRLRPQRMMALGYLLIGVGFALNGAAHSVAWLFLAMTIFTIGEMTSMPVSSAYIAQIAPEQMRGRYMGALSVTWSLSSIIGPQFGFRLMAHQPHLLWLTCGLLGASAAATLLFSGGQGKEIASADGAAENDDVPESVPAVTLD